MKTKIIAILITFSTTVITAFGAAGCSRRTENVGLITEMESLTDESTISVDEKNDESQFQSETSESVLIPDVTKAEKITEKESNKETQSETSVQNVVPTQPQTQAPTVAPTQPATQPQAQAPTTVAPTQSSTQKQTQAPTVAPTQPATQPQTQAPTTAAPTQAQTQPTTTKEKTIWDYPFSHEDLEAIKAQCIAWGEEIGLKHVTGVRDGEGCENLGPQYDPWAVYTPENTSWDLPIDICEDWCGEKAKNKFEEWVKTEPESIITYGGRQIRYFTIWYEEFDNGNIVFYFLY